MVDIPDPLPAATQVGREPCTVCAGKGWYFVGGWPTRCDPCLERERQLKRTAKAKPKATAQPARVRK